MFRCFKEMQTGTSDGSNTHILLNLRQSYLESVRRFCLGYGACYLVRVIKDAVGLIWPDESVLFASLDHAIYLHFITTYLCNQASIWSFVILEKDKPSNCEVVFSIRRCVIIRYFRVGSSCNLDTHTVRGRNTVVLLKIGIYTIRETFN